jgi:hypothetical protein
MIKIVLNKKEYQYLCQMNNDFNKNIKIIKNNKSILIECSEEQADEIRDACGEKLQIVGFGKNYELTNEGRILEDLIDKFFIG